MPQLPDPLADDARDKWAAISGAALKRGLELRIPAELAEESRTVLACSDFVARTAQRMPAVFDDLLHSGDLQRAYPPGTFQAIVQTCLPPPADDLESVQQLLGVAFRSCMRACADSRALRLEKAKPRSNSSSSEWVNWAPVN